MVRPSRFGRCVLAALAAFSIDACSRSPKKVSVESSAACPGGAQKGADGKCPPGGITTGGGTIGGEAAGGGVGGGVGGDIGTSVGGDLGGESVSDGTGES